MVTSVLTLQPGGTTGRHVHNGLEVGYVLDGDIELVSDTEALRYFSAGETFVTYPDLPHTVNNRHEKPAHILATMIVDTGKPATQVVGNA